MNGFFFGGFDIYPEDDPVPEIVLLAKKGDLSSIKHYIAKNGDLDLRQRWTEVEPKYGYDKSWEWFGNSALMEATQRGNIKIVIELLLGGADPMLKSCAVCDSYHSALDIAKKKGYKKISKIIESVLNLWKKLNPNSHDTAHYDSQRQKKNKPSMKDIQSVISKC